MSKYIVGVFDDEEPLLASAKELTEKGVKIYEVYSPFPIHGIDPILGYKRTRLTIAAFCFGTFALASAVFMQAWMYGIDWRVNVGGKPRFPWVSFIPVSFELTILTTALGMMACYFFVNRLYPGKEARIAHPRATNDRFIITLKPKAVIGHDVVSLMQGHGALEVYEDDLRI